MENELAGASVVLPLAICNGRERLGKSKKSSSMMHGSIVMGIFCFWRGWEMQSV